jgi:hypothetical protein
MNWTSTDAARRRVVVAGLIAGPAVLLASNAFIVLDAPGGMRAEFDAMAAQPWLLLVQSVLEALGFTIAMASYAGVPHALRTRGGAFGTWGAALCIIGILGFVLSAAGGLFLYVVARIPDHDTGFAAGAALNADPVTGDLIMVLTLAGEVGVCLVVIGLMRARLVSFWPLVIVIAGIVADYVLPSVFSGLVADALLLAASAWIGVALARAPKDAWLGASVPARLREAAVAS